MRTLATQVRLRRLDRAFSEALDRLLSEPAEREMVGLISAKLLELASDVREAWRRESAKGQFMAGISFNRRGHRESPLADPERREIRCH